MSANIERLTDWRDYFELTKPRVVMLIVFTAVVGMFLAVPGWPGASAMLFGTIGIGMAASAAAATATAAGFLTARSVMPMRRSLQGYSNL